MTTFAQTFLAEATEVIAKLDASSIEKAAQLLAATRAAGGRLFILGVGGSAANASHAVNDFRKIAGIEAYAPTDNVSELTARVNDEGWASIFDSWLRTSRLRPDDALLIFSVGGGNLEQNVSPNLVAALKYAKSVGAKIIGVVGRDGGYTATVADACILIPVVNSAHITPHTEAFQAVVWHLLVSHPAVKTQSTKWESLSGTVSAGNNHVGTAALGCPVEQSSTVSSAPKARAVFLDRDGVLNRSLIRDHMPYAPTTPEEFEILPGVPEALNNLKRHNYKLIVVTNQPDISRGTQSPQILAAMHQILTTQLPLDDILTCPHTDADHCTCRKPQPGMLLEAARKYNIDLANSFMIGDRWRDIEAGYNAGCKTILIDYGYSERPPDHAPDLRVSSLREAADWITRSTPKGAHP
jgi:D-sedoheptulose 7-phosphate isomerase